MCRIFEHFLLVLLFSCSAYCAEADSDWASAKTLFDQGNASAAYDALSKIHSDDAAYYYDLGTVASKLGKTGEAIGNLEKALRRKPHDPEIQRNLEAVRQQAAHALGNEMLDPASTWSENLAEHVSLEELRGVLGLFGLVLSFFWLRAYRKSRSLRETLLHPSNLFALFAFLLVVGLYVIEIDANSHLPAVALSRTAMRSGPGASFVQLGEVSPGVTVRLLGRSAAAEDDKELWLQVRYSHDGIGWVRASNVLVVD